MRLTYVNKYIACCEAGKAPPWRSLSVAGLTVNIMQLKIQLKRPLFILGIVGVAFVLIIIFSKEGLHKKIFSPMNAHIPQNTGYHANITSETQENENFRRVLFTGQKSQLVVMSIPPGGEVGEEVHRYTEQTLFFLSGRGEGEFDGKEFPVGPGDVVVVTAGTKHNFRNIGTDALKIYTVYTPPNHIDGRVHHTKAEADADTADEAIGGSEPLK